MKNLNKIRFILNLHECFIQFYYFLFYKYLRFLVTFLVHHHKNQLISFCNTPLLY
jgi:hypothetical protein